MQLFFPPVAEQHSLYPILLDDWLAGFCFWVIVNPCMIFFIAQAGRHSLGKHVFIWVSHAFGHYITLFIIEGSRSFI